MHGLRHRSLPSVHRTSVVHFVSDRPVPVADGDRLVQLLRRREVQLGHRLERRVLQLVPSGVVLQCGSQRVHLVRRRSLPNGSERDIVHELC